MAKGLKGITVKIDGDTKNLVEKLKDTEKESRGLERDLKSVNSLLKFDTGNTDLLKQKQVLLSQAIEQTEDKLKLLKQAQAEMKAEGKDVNDEAYRDLERAIVSTEQKLSGYNTQLKNAQEQQSKAAKEAETFGQKIQKISSHIPVVNKIVDGFAKVKGKITETVKESTSIKKIGDAVNTVKEKVTAFEGAHPKVAKVADAFHNIKDKAVELKDKLPSVKQSLEAIGHASAAVASGGFKVVTTAVGATAKAFTAFATTVATTGAALAKSAVTQYADYEQLAGGVDTLFKDSSETVKQYANDAYKTAGMSANEYMEAVTGFSASLIQSMGGDTKAAAEKANMAIVDMSDNANKMGTDIESIKNAYSGFAKSNFTMLDNLKLGYGGTKEEMERLLEDASKLSGIEYDISSYADIVDAIHVVQTEMGITGTTAKEASETITGSLNATKSAWNNLLTGLADDNADLDGLMDNLTESIETTIDNIVPRIFETIPRLTAAIPRLIDSLAGLAGKLAGKVGGLIEQLLPQLIKGFFTLIKAVTATLPTFVPQILSAAITLFSGLLTGLNDTIPLLLAMLPEIIQNITATLTENLPSLIASGVDILVNLISGVTQAIPSLIESIIALIPVITGAITDNLPKIIEAGLNLLMALASGIIQAIPQLVAMLPTVISSILTTITQNLPKIITSGIELLGALISGIIQAIPQLVAALPQVFTAIINAFKNIDWASLGKNIIDGVINGVKNAASSLINVFIDLANSALDAIKNFFGIASPSRVMRDEVGKMLPAGMAIGVEEGMEDEEERIRNAMQKGVPTTFDSYMANVRGSRTAAAGSEAAAGGFVQNLTINSPRELSPSETARQNKIATQQMILKLRKA